MELKKIILSEDRYIYMYSELAEFVQEYASIDPIVELIDEDGNASRTEQRQNEFCEIVEVVEEIMNRSGIIKAEDKT